jgi:polar amino acid transport system permease protein
MQSQGKPASTASQPTPRLIPVDVSARIDAWWGLFLAVILIILALVIFKPDPYLDILVFVVDGIKITLLVTVASFILTLIVGLFGGLGRLSKNKLIFGISSLYVELVRGIPLLVQLIWWYFAFPVVVQSIGESLGIAALENFRADAVAMSILGLTFCYGAYMSEIYRAGIQSIPKGQTEAAMSLGMNYFQSMRHVILPQAIRMILPPVSNEFIALLKDSSLVSAVAVVDLTRRGREYMSSNFIPIETWIMVALLYLVLTLFSARVASYIEKKVKVAER